MLYFAQLSVQRSHDKVLFTAELIDDQAAQRVIVAKDDDVQLWAPIISGRQGQNFSSLNQADRVVIQLQQQFALCRLHLIGINA